MSHKQTIFHRGQNFKHGWGRGKGTGNKPSDHKEVYFMVIFTINLFHLTDINEYKSNSICKNSYC